MLIALIVMAVVFAVLMVATIALSSDPLAIGIRGTVRYGILGTAIFLPFAALLALFGGCIYAVIAGILYIYNM
ncbi:MAG TPA: hypothetical protein VN415_09205 [Dehalococcoidia bacterium]|jgi:hypothetical protein|nr:hypothetical protein [Dehalococcoidia bacterium]